jgi:mannose/cellobiose epimerase-like protein (N-acyl-D-glucosamine 2-epimerase family)
VSIHVDQHDGGAVIPFDAVRRWVFDEALPWWASEGVEPGLGFVERMTVGGRADPAVPFKRVRVQARQLYVFSHAATLGWGPAGAAAENGWRFLKEHGVRADGGFARTLGRAGGVLDPELDLYDLAFVLFALGWYHRASGDPEPLRLAEAAWTAAERGLGRPDGRGFRAAGDAGWEGQQNPHMHLLEATLGLYEATGEDRWAEEARRLGRLFAETLFDPATGTLAEHYDAGWRRVAPVLVEPGHHFEWAWLLRRLKELTGDDHLAAARELFAFGEACGVDPADGLVWDVVTDRGAVVKPTHRLWAPAELLKARLARAEFEGEADRPGIALAARNLLDFYVRPAPSGCWCDQLDENGRWTDDKVPASSLYHLFLSFSELLRLQPLLEERG